MTQLAGSVVLVTGASRGIGAAVAQAAANRGAHVALLARSGGDLDRVRGSLRGDRHLAVVADLADPGSTGGAVARVEQELGPVEVLVNNAGIGAYGAIAETDLAVFERMMSVNYLGTVAITKAVLGGMMARRRGHVVTVASVAGRMAAPFEAAYSASKYAQVAFSEVLAVEAAPFGIGVSLVDPGVVATAFFETRGKPYEKSFPKPIAPGKVADAVIGAVEHDRAEVFVPHAMRVAYTMTALAPPLAASGKRRTFARELSDLVARHRETNTASTTVDVADREEHR
ncbi:MAG: SDR family NAD(P)-dependent oxidoreductase [Acidimicrobiia bacterium]